MPDCKYGAASRVGAHLGGRGFNAGWVPCEAVPAAANRNSPAGDRQVRRILGIAQDRFLSCLEVAACVAVSDLPALGAGSLPLAAQGGRGMHGPYTTVLYALSAWESAGFGP